MTVTLGEKYSDPFTGFEGHATARTEHLGGPVQVKLERPGATTIENQWFYEDRLRPVLTGNVDRDLAIASNSLGFSAAT